MLSARRLVLLLGSIGLLAACEADDVAHATAGFFVSRIVTEQTGSQLYGCAAAIGAGVLKELYDDRNGGDVEGSDVAFTAAGCLIEYEF
ncbi:MAG: hypothetical protein AAF330_01300 [Pseudomonadota bacterium]